MGDLLAKLRHHLTAAFLAAAAAALLAAGPTGALAGVIGSKGEVRACFVKSGKKAGTVRLLVKGKCKKGEKAISWSQKGQQGPQGPQGEQGTAGAAGASGSPDSPAQVLAKVLGVDGAGSGLDADLLDGNQASAFAFVTDVFTKAQSDARYQRSSPREVFVPTTGDAEADGQAVVDAMAALPSTTTAPAELRLAAGRYVLPDDGSIPTADLVVPSAVTLKGAGRRATVLVTQSPVELGNSATLEDIFVSSVGPGTAAVRVTGSDALVADAILERIHNIDAVALGVNAGATVTVRDSSLSAKGLGSIVPVHALDLDGRAMVLDTTISADDGAAFTKGIEMGASANLTMIGGTVDADDDSFSGTGSAETNDVTALGLAGSAVMRNVRVRATSSVNSAAINSPPEVRGALTTGTSGMTLDSVFISASSPNIDEAFRFGAATNILIEGSQLEAPQAAGDIGLSGGSGSIKVADTRISAATEGVGGTRVCFGDYDAAFVALSATCN